MSHNGYGDHNIKELSSLQGIRKHPGMYIRNIGEEGLIKMFLEIFMNSCDEYRVGRCSTINIRIDSINKMFAVEDDGAGLPQGKAKGIVTKTHMGGKFDNNAYQFSSGLHGVGMTVVNALSDFFEVRSRRDGNELRLVFKNEEEEPSVEEKKPYKGLSGTTVTWHPDPIVMKDLTVTKRKYEEILDVITSINKGVKVILDWDGEKKIYHNISGLPDYMGRMIIKKRKYKLIFANPFEVETKSDDGSMELRVCVNFVSNSTRESSLSYVNGLPTAEGGMHVSGVGGGITTIINRLINKGDYLPKSSKLVIKSEDIKSNMVSVIVASHNDPQFDGQTKERFTSMEFMPFARASISTTFAAWCENNASDFDKLAKIIIRTARARVAAIEAKSKVLKSGMSKNNIFSTVDRNKFTDCKSNKPEECEIFLVEGDSAGGTTSLAIDSRYQAIFKLRGKAKNMLKSNKFSDELISLIHVLGMGHGKTKSVDKLRFHKIVILCDADVDGEHIRSLMLGFFHKFYPEVIERGYLYVGMPPLYHIKTPRNPKGIYVLNSEHYNAILIEVSKKLFKLMDNNGTFEIKDEIFTEYLMRLSGYKELLDLLSVSLSFDPVLLELIIKNIDDIMKSKFKSVKRYGYKGRMVKENSSTNKFFEFDESMNHYFLQIDKNFYNNVYLPIMNKLAEIKLINVRLKGRKSGVLYSDLTYVTARLISESLNSKGVKISRFKGLGEMNPDQLEISAIDPKTRNIVRVELEDVEQTEFWMNGLIGKNIEVKKAMFTKVH